MWKRAGRGCNRHGHQTPARCPDLRGIGSARSDTTNCAGPHGTGRRTNKPKGRGVGGRSAPIVPLTLGNRGQRDPAEERRASHEQIH